MGYADSKVYKLVSESGHYYYGSTIQSLNERLWHHKGSSRTMTSKLYKHVQEVGWDKVRIELVESVTCENRKDLRIVENRYILASKDDPLCLNTLRSYTPDVEKKTMERERQERNKEHRKEVVHTYYEQHKDAINDRNKAYYAENKSTLNAKHTEYLENHKEDIKSQRKRYYDENKERLCQEKREKYEKNKEEWKHKWSQYRANNRERINQRKREAHMRKKNNQYKTETVPTDVES